MIVKKFCAALVAFTLVVNASTRAQADPPKTEDSAVAPIKKDQRAPFDGILFTAVAAAALKAEIDAQKKRTQLEVERTQKECRAVRDRDVQQAAIDAEASRRILQAQLVSRTSEVNVLQDRVSSLEKERPNMLLWVGGGVVAGIAVTALTTFLVTSANK